MTLVTSVVAGSLILAGCGGGTESGSDGDDTVDVLVLAPLSGPVADLGEVATTAFTAAAKVINSEGGILGRDVKVTFKDDRFDPVTAQNVLREALDSDDPPDLVFPGATSVVTVPILPLLTQNKILSIGSATSPLANDAKKFPYGFNMSSQQDANQRVMAEFLSEEGLTKVGALVTSEETGEVVADSLARQAEEAGVEVEFEKLEADTVDATAELSRLQRNNPQALVLDSFTSPGTLGVILDSKDKLGWDVPTIFGSFNAVQGIEKATEDQLRGSYHQGASYTIKGSERQQTDDYKAFQAAIDAESPTKKYPNFAYGHQYSTLLTFRAAAEKAGSLEAPEVAKAIESLKTDEDIPGWFITEAPDFSADQHQPTWGPEDGEVVKLAFPGYDPKCGCYLPATN